MDTTPSEVLGEALAKAGFHFLLQEFKECFNKDITKTISIATQSRFEQIITSYDKQAQIRVGNVEAQIKDL